MAIAKEYWGAQQDDDVSTMRRMTLVDAGVFSLEHVPRPEMLDLEEGEALQGGLSLH